MPTNPKNNPNKPVALPDTTSPEQTAAGLDPNRDIEAPGANSVGDTVNPVIGDATVEPVKPVKKETPEDEFTTSETFKAL